MSKPAGESEPLPQDTELNATQIATKELADEILALKPERLLTSVITSVSTEPNEVLERLQRTSASELLLGEGESLSAVSPSDYQPDLGLFVGEAKLTHVEIAAAGWDYDKVRKHPDTEEFIEFPGEQDWLRQVSVRLWYAQDGRRAFQKLTLQAQSGVGEAYPKLFRDVYTPAYAEMGYDGHNQVHQTMMAEEDVTAYLDLVRGLLEDRQASY